jgi:aminopeptidase N
MHRVPVGCVLAICCMAAAPSHRPGETPQETRQAARDAAPAAGVPLSLAEERARRITDLRYELRFSIPAGASAAIDGEATIRFTLKDAARPLAIDFSPPGPRRARIRGRGVTLTSVNEHLLVQPAELQEGPNEITIDFVAGNESLNRNPDFMYSLFVPARARLAFPCFDQPDLKAKYTLRLEIPDGWEALSNGEETTREGTSGRTIIS